VLPSLTRRRSSSMPQDYDQVHYALAISMRHGVVYRAFDTAVYRGRYAPNADRARPLGIARYAVPAQLAIPSNTERYRVAAADTELDRPHTEQCNTTKLLGHEPCSSPEQLCVQPVTCLSLSVAYSASNSAKQSIPSNTEYTELCSGTDNTEHTDRAHACTYRIPT
jgi:hypothetical protein